MPTRSSAECSIGITVHAVVVLATVGSGSAPTDWFRIRQLEGPIGYHNGEATICAMGVPARTVGGHLRPPVAARGRCSGCRSLPVDRPLDPIAWVARCGGPRRPGATGAGPTRPPRSSRGVTRIERGSSLLFIAQGRSSAHRRSTARRPGVQELRLGHAVVALVVGGLSSMSLPANRLTRRRTYTVVGAAVAVTVVVATIGLAVLATHVDDLRDRITAEPNRPSEVVGATRDCPASRPRDESSCGSVALDMSAEAPAVGHGAGSFARRWTIDRTNKDAYVLQPHSLELELLAELGVVGLVLLTAAIGGLTWGVVRGVRRDRAVGGPWRGDASRIPPRRLRRLDSQLRRTPDSGNAARRGSCGAGQASHSERRLARSATSSWCSLPSVCSPAQPLPNVSSTRPRSQAATSSASAWATAASARRWDRWDPAVVEFQALLAQQARQAPRRGGPLSPGSDAQRPAVDEQLPRGQGVGAGRTPREVSGRLSPGDRGESTRGRRAETESATGAVTSESVTFDGRSLTLKGRTLNGSIADSEIWYLIAPPAGAGTVKVKLSTARTIVAGAISFTGAHQLTPLGRLSGIEQGVRTAATQYGGERERRDRDRLTLAQVGRRPDRDRQPWTDSRYGADPRMMAISGIIGGVSTAAGRRVGDDGLDVQRRGHLGPRSRRRGTAPQVVRLGRKVSLRWTRRAPRPRRGTSRRCPGRTGPRVQTGCCVVVVSRRDS